MPGSKKQQNWLYECESDWSQGKTTPFPGQYCQCWRCEETQTTYKVGDYLTYQVKFDQTGQGNPLCKLCRGGNETISHIISVGPTYDELRNRVIQQLSDVCLVSKSSIHIQTIVSDPKLMTQFILDPTSFNLKESVHISDPTVQKLFKLSGDICFGIHSDQIRQLQRLKENLETSWADQQSEFPSIKIICMIKMLLMEMN